MGLSLRAKLGNGAQPRGKAGRWGSAWGQSLENGTQLGGSVSRRGRDITGNNAPQTASGDPRGHLADLIIHTHTNHTVLIH